MFSRKCTLASKAEVNKRDVARAGVCVQGTCTLPAVAGCSKLYTHTHSPIAPLVVPAEAEGAVVGGAVVSKVAVWHHQGQVLPIYFLWTSPQGVSQQQQNKTHSSRKWISQQQPQVQVSIRCIHTCNRSKRALPGTWPLLQLQLYHLFQTAAGWLRCSVAWEDMLRQAAGVVAATLKASAT